MLYFNGGRYLFPMRRSVAMRWGVSQTGTANKRHMEVAKAGRDEKKMGDKPTTHRLGNSTSQQGVPSEGPTTFVGINPPCFSKEELSEFKSLVVAESREAIVGGRAKKPADSIRRSRVLWLRSDRHQWVMDRLWDVAVEVNKNYQYRIDRFQGPVQLAIYDEKIQGFYRWHLDIAPRTTTRKITIQMPLNEPSDYEGGNLEFNAAGTPNKAPQQQGTVITFPSFILHRVTPVTKGARYSLVAWITGPPWG